MAPRKQTVMTDDHKAALAEGRAESRKVKGYLEALEANRPKRGRKRTPDSIRKRLDQIQKELATVGPLKRVNLIQERMDLQNELNTELPTTDISELEEAFIGAAKSYSARKGLSYAAWRELGVPGPVLAKAGISRKS